jgi:2-amino-4-hydroxy-6-hydroxymethyldihydropteridine diphosphokinase
MDLENMPVTAYIALGSNLGDREANLDRALELLRAAPDVMIVKVSRYHETDPVGGPPGQGKYLNAVAELQVFLEPAELLRVMLDVEHRLGRVRAERFGPRTIDLDLLLYGDKESDEPNLSLPHPRMHERAFVLAPLAEIAPAARHPRFDCTVLDLLRAFSVGGPDPPGRELAGKRALVTGSTSGIGRAIALELAAAGAHVIVHGRRLPAMAEVCGEVRKQGVQAAGVLGELAEPDRRSSFVEYTWRVWGGVDIWINNAGADTLTGEAADWPFERKLQELWAVDVTATIAMSRYVGQRMKAAGGGVIINMGWDRAETGMEGDSGQLFAATKGAVMAFTKSLALDLAPEVRVNCLAPGWIKTAWGQSASKSWQERAVQDTPLGRWGTPEDVGKVARWLASPAAAFLTGQIIRVNGGAVR